MESTLTDLYKKNKGINKKMVNEFHDLGIMTYQTFILGLPHHTRTNIHLEIANNLDYQSTMYGINTLKPIRTTSIYNELSQEGTVFGDDLPPNLWYKDGFFPFKHKNLGGGFSALKYAFKAYVECEKKNIDIYSNMVQVLKKSHYWKSSKTIRRTAKIFISLSGQNLKLSKERMSDKWIQRYETRLAHI
jgi:hypothetical protein